MDAAFFHPAVEGWFCGRFGEPTDAQRLAWPKIAEGGHVLLAAPTGSGKTLAAFLVCIDRLLREALSGGLSDRTQVVYISPLKALSNDIRRNLQVPLEEIRATALAQGHEPPPIRVAVRTGDTPPAERQAMVKKPPHIVVTTPESLYLLLTSVKGRELLSGVRTVIVDEIHALARDKRGSHLALSLARLDRLCERPPVRIGLSATQRPIDEIARFLVGTGNVSSANEPNCHIIDTGHVRELDLAVVTPPSELSAVCSIEQWQEAYAQLGELIQTHRSTLVFVNTRRMAERVCHQLEQQLGAGHVASHHGSLSRDTRLLAEERLKSGELQAIVATASLELGIDIGYIDLVCQIGSPRSIATLLQRVGRSGHSLGRIPKGRLFALTRDDLLEMLAIVRAVRLGRLDQVEMPVAPLDILAQQIIAEVAAEDWSEDELFALCRQAWPYCELTRSDFDAVVRLVSEGVAPTNRSGAYVHRDRIGGQLRARRGARLAALTSGGAIPETADYRVVTEGERTFVGTVNEDFAIESQSGDVFLLGNTSWRIRYVRGGEVTVADAHGAAASVPFWLGEAPGRTIELSTELSNFREALWRAAGESPIEAAAWLVDECGADADAARQAVEYVSAQAAAIGLIPTQQQIVFERFFDESGGMQLVIHSPLGTRINRAWGLALRKCFCRTFDFELQAAADDNGIVLSIGPNHSFPLERMFELLSPRSGPKLLVQALLAAPMFQIRWRWNATRALAVLRQRGGKKVPPALQRFRADDLLTAVFPMQTACFEHRTGDLEVPDHPLARQTVHDCLHEAMDLPRWLGVLQDIEAGRIELVARDTREPSPFCQQLLNSNPYTFLDDAPLEERRARAVSVRRTIDSESVRDLGRLDPLAIAQVRREAWPLVRDLEELHDALLTVVGLPEEEGAAWGTLFDELVAAGRATRCAQPGGPTLWAAAEELPVLQAALATMTAHPPVELPAALRRTVEPDDAKQLLVRGRLQVAGPTTAGQVARDLGLAESAVQAALVRLEAEGLVLRGQFTGDRSEVEWCERRLLARIHRLTLDGLRRQVQPVPPEDFLRFLLRHQQVAGDCPNFAQQNGTVPLASPRGAVEAVPLVSSDAGRHGLSAVIAQLQGFEAPAGAWEQDILPARIAGYEPQSLDGLFQSGEVVWGRLQPPSATGEKRLGGHTLTRVKPIALARRADLAWLLPSERADLSGRARGNAQIVLEALTAHGALFFDDLAGATGLLRAQLEDALGELAALGLVTADGFAAVRAIVSRRKHAGRRFAARAAGMTQRRARAYAQGGRWSRFPPFVQPPSREVRLERWARQLLARYGVVFRDLLARESTAPTWSELAPVYRRLEMRGEIRGGRFVAGVGGEQFALGPAVELLRRVRDEAPAHAWQVLSAADPLNLVGILTAGPRVPATRGNRILLLDGRPIAYRIPGEVAFLADLDEPDRHRATRLLHRPDVAPRESSSLLPTPSVS